MSDWTSPPTPEEEKAAGGTEDPWAHPPTPEEMGETPTSETGHVIHVLSHPTPVKLLPLGTTGLSMMGKGNLHPHAGLEMAASGLSPSQNPATPQPPDVAAATGVLAAKPGNLEEAGDTDPTQKLNPMEGLNKLKNQITAPVLHPLEKAAGGAAGLLGRGVGLGTATGEYEARALVNGLLGDAAFESMDPKERRDVEQTLMDYYGKTGATVLKFGAGAVPMFAFGGGASADEQLPALSRLFSSMKTGAVFGLADALGNKEASLEGSALAGAATGAVAHAATEGAGKLLGAIAKAAVAPRIADTQVIGWMTPAFRAQVERELETLSVRPGEQIPPETWKWLEEQLGLVQEKLKAKGFVPEGGPEDLAAHEKGTAAQMQMMGGKAGKPEEPFAPYKAADRAADEQKARLAQKEAMKASGRDEMKTMKSPGKVGDTKVSRPEDLPQGPALALIDDVGHFDIAPTAQRVPKGSNDVLKPGDPVVLPDGLKATYQGENKVGAAVVRLPDGNDATLPKHLVAHSPDGAVLPSGVEGAADKPPVTPEALDTFYKSVPNPSIQDFKAAFGVSDSEAAALKATNPPPAILEDTKNAKPYEGIPPSPPPKAPPPTPLPPGGKPIISPYDQAQYDIMVNPRSASLLESYAKSVGGVGMNVSIPEAVNAQATSLRAAKALKDLSADWLATAKRLNPKYTGKPVFEADVSKFADHGMSMTDLRDKYPDVPSEYWNFLQRSANIVQRNHNLLKLGDSESYQAMLYMKHINPERFLKSLPITKVVNAKNAVMKKWDVNEPQAYEILHHILGTDDLNRAVPIIRGMGGVQNRFKSLTDLPNEVREMLMPAGGNIRVAYSMAAQESIKYTRAILNTVKRDPAVFSLDSLSRGKGFVPVPENIGMWLGSSEMDGGFWHRDLADAWQNPGAMHYAAWQHSMLANKAMQAAGWRKGQLIFGPTTFLKHVDQMRYGSMLAGGLSWLHPVQAGADLLEAHRQLRAFKMEPTFANPEAASLMRAKVNGGMGQNHAAYESKNEVVDSYFNELEGKWSTEDKPTIHSFWHSAFDLMAKRGGLGGRGAQLVYQGLQDRVQLANFIGLERKLIAGGMDASQASQIAGRRVAMSFPDASNTGTIPNAIRSNPFKANMMTMATPFWENIRINSMIPYRLQNGESDIASRLLAHHVINLLTYGATGYGVRQRVIGGLGGAFITGGAMGILRALNGVSNDQVEAAIAGQGKTGQSADPFIVPGIGKNAQEEPNLYNGATGSYAMELARGVLAQDSWSGKSVKLLTNGLNAVGSPELANMTEQAALGLHLVDDDGYSPAKMYKPGHPVQTALKVGTAFGAVPLSQMVGHAVTEYGEQNPTNVKTEAPELEHAVRGGIFGHGFALPESRGFMEPVSEIRQARQDYEATLAKIRKDPSLNADEKNDVLQEAMNKFTRAVNRANEKAQTISKGAVR